LIKERLYQYYFQLHVVTNVAEFSVKEIAREQCRVKEQYLEEWKAFELQVH
jgi:hypothetical protein